MKFDKTLSIKRQLGIVLLLIESTILFFYHNNLLAILPPLDSPVIKLIALLVPGGVLLSINNSILIPLFIFIIKFFYGLFLRIIWIPKSFLLEVQEGCIKWLIALSTKWGKYANSNNQKAINTADGIISLYNSGAENRTKYNDLIYSLQKSLFARLTSDGVLDESNNTFTTEATARVCYSILRTTEGKSELTRSQLDILREIKQKFLLAYTSPGWGIVVNKTPKCLDVRYYETILVLMFLNKTDYKESADFKSMIYRVVEKSNYGLIGFVHNDKSKVVTTSMLLSLVLDLDPNLREDILIKHIEIDRVVKFILTSFKKAGSVVESEHKDGFNTYAEGNYEGETHTYLSAGWALYTISKVYELGYLGFKEKVKFIFLVKSIINNCIEKDGDRFYFSAAQISQSKKGFSTDLTISFLFGLNKFIIAMYDNRGDSLIEKTLDAIASKLKLNGADINNIPKYDKDTQI